MCEKRTMTTSKPDPYLDWIREGLKQPGKTQTGLAAHMGVAHPQVTQLLKGRRQLKVYELAKIAEYLGTSLETPEVRLYTGPMRTAPIAGTVEAGTFREVDEFDQSEPEQVQVAPDVKFPHARQVVFNVSGDSMNDLKPRPILAGDRLVCVAYEDVAGQVALRDGMVVVLQRTRDGGHYREWSVKQVQIYADRTEFHPRSTNPKHRPIIIERDMFADDGVTVDVLALVRRVENEIGDNF